MQLIEKNGRKYIVQPEGSIPVAAEVDVLKLRNELKKQGVDTGC